MYKSYKIRLFPNEEQEYMFYKHIGCCRKVWNIMLKLQNFRYHHGGVHLSHYDMNNLLTIIKKKKRYNYLNEVSSQSLYITCNDLDKSFKSFFNKISKYPRYKSRKKSKLSFPVRPDNLYFLDNTVNIEKIGKVHYKHKSKFKIPIGMHIVKFINPRISLIHDKWILSFTIECDNQTPKEHLVGDMGIDLGIKNLAIISLSYDEDNTYRNISKDKNIIRLNHKLKHLQRKLARKYRANNSYENTNNILKTKKQIKDIYYKIHCIKVNYIHHITKNLISYYPKRITMENLGTKNMMKNHKLAKAIQEACWCMFKTILQYKCNYNGIEFLMVPRNYKSSKTCSKCGHIKKKLLLSDRIYKCKKCGLIIDRDLNAAINIRDYYYNK